MENAKQIYENAENVFNEQEQEIAENFLESLAAFLYAVDSFIKLLKIPAPSATEKEIKKSEAQQRIYVKYITILATPLS